jgi:hypothetical protein
MLKKCAQGRAASLHFSFLLKHPVILLARSSTAFHNSRMLTSASPVITTVHDIQKVSKCILKKRAEWNMGNPVLDGCSRPSQRDIAEDAGILLVFLFPKLHL